MKSSRTPKPRKSRVLLSRLALSVLGPIKKELPSQNLGTQILLQETGRIPTQEATRVGCFNITASHKKYATKAMFHVVQNRDFACSSLLSASTSETLGIISFSHSIKVPDDIFHEFGKSEGINIKFHIDNDVQPKAQAYRRIPYHVRKEVEKK
ncbi:RNA-directed DNA polymerase-like protein [Plakobranchus ocellatus]|uniref:RNA-directed DNA polymerase-like protein n=1 Tax=Plakobranchus ocellatus TaxID=259542 RepID=A0AAV3ZXD4_9GAST|nr:RNA-directed DNA polymerase-like protein [Plakobranchus ocellatus]